MEDVDFVDDDSSDYSSDLEQSNIDFVDDDGVVFENEESPPNNTKNQRKKKSSATKSTTKDPSEYMERRMIFQKALKEIKDAKGMKQKQHLLKFWKERLRPKDYEKLERTIAAPMGPSKSIDTEKKTQNVNSPSNIQNTSSIWDNMFVPNYVRGSINFDEWDEYEEISESDM